MDKVRRFITAFLILMFIFTPQYAEAGDGAGPSVPLYIQSSFPANGDTKVSQTPGNMWIRYSHNVADPLVSGGNTALISLMASDGSYVPVKVWCYDAQIEFDERQYIYLTPQVELNPQTTYRIVASPGVAARNGIHVTSSSESVTFTTGGTVPESEAQADVSQVVTEESIDRQVEEYAEIEAEDETEKGEVREENNRLWWVLGAAFLILAVAVVVLTVIRDGKRNGRI